jgi:phage shock protein E
MTVLRGSSHRPARVLLPALAAIVAALALAGCGGSSSDASTTTGTAEKATVTLVSPAEAQSLIAAGGVTLLDVRTPEEYASGHIAGARNVDFEAADFGDRIGALDHGARYVVYCHSGNRSGQATAQMAEQGFTSVSDVDGGIEAWQAARLPVVSGS